MAEEANQNTQGVSPQGDAQGSQNTPQSAPQIDYSKIEEIVKSGTAQKESAILKSYFSQQGLSAEEMTAAISAYKEQTADGYLYQNRCYGDLFLLKAKKDGCAINAEA